MKRFFVCTTFITAILHSTCFLNSDTNVKEKNLQGWTKVWSDEFDYDGMPDAERWDYESGGHGWGNKESAYYTDKRKKNIFVSDGVLTIRAHKERYNNSDYTSGRINTRLKGDWKYGRVEVRAKLPSGRGIWPAIWMLPTYSEYGAWPDSGEIDIMEYIGIQPGIIHTSINTQTYSHKDNTHKTAAIHVTNPDKEFHVYGIEWFPERIDFFIDEKKVFTYEKESDSPDKWPFDKDFYLILNVAIGGDWGGRQGIDEKIFPADMKVDYVRVYENAKNAPPFFLNRTSTEGGDLKITPFKDKYESSEEIKIEAMPRDGYEFIRWEGNVSGRKNPLVIRMNRNIHITPIFKEINELIENGDFHSGKRNWVLQVFDEAEAELVEKEKNLEIKIGKLSGEDWKIQLNQYNIHLEKGTNYRITFTAWGDNYKPILAGIARGAPPYTPYYQRRILLNPEPVTFSFDFTIVEEKNNNARFFLDLGHGTEGVYLTHVSLKKIH